MRCSLSRKKMTMELLQFRYFLEAARYENLTRASEELHVVQPALSQSIRRLENELGVQLFDRKNHRLVLNAQGKLLEKRLTAIMGAVDNLRDELWESIHASERTIHLSFFAASPFITDCIISYRKKHPDVNFQVSQQEIGDGCDIHVYSQASVPGVGHRVREELPEGIVRQDILTEEIFLAVPSDSPLASRKSVDLRDLKEESYIRISHNWQLRGICDSFCRRAGVRPQMIFESGNPESVRNLIAAGIGIGFWPERSWGSPPGDQVALVPIRFPSCRRDILLTLYGQEGRKPVVEDFYDYMCMCFKGTGKDRTG